MPLDDDEVGAGFQDRLEALLRSGRSHPAELFRDAPDDFWLWAHTEGREVSAELRALLPDLPADQQQRRWTGKQGRETQVEGFDIYRAFRDLHTEHFGDLRRAGPVLDFGCGWGRVIRYFLRDTDPDQLLGTDYDQANVDFCRTAIPWCRFTRNEAGPPLPFDDGELGLIYAYSVFSHFSEPMHRRWLEELRRILRPGGALVVTVRPRRFIEHARRLREAGARRVEARMFPETEEALASYDDGQFCFTAYNPSGVVPWWGEACIPHSYVETRWTDLFEVVEFDTSSLKQHIVLLRA